MATMQKFRSLREAQKIAREELASVDGRASIYVLRRDGDTDKYSGAASGKIEHSKEAGWITLGLVVDETYMPCIISSAGQW